MWKNKSKKLAYFLTPFMRRQLTTFHHVSPRIHHVFTIQKPRPNTHFSQNPLQKAQQSSKKIRFRGADFFLQTTAFSE
jgi:hypothetical protein